MCLIRTVALREAIFSVIDPLVPAVLQDRPEALHGARFLAGAVLLANAVSWFTAAAFAASGLTYAALVTILYGPIVAIPLLWMRLTGDTTRSMHLALAITGAYFVINTLVQSPLDVSQLFYIGVIPIGALFGLGRGAGVVWGALSLVLGAIPLVAEALGWSGGQTPTHPLVVVASRLFTFLIALFFMGLLFDAARRRALADVVFARDEAQRASAAKSQFLANVSHELRTPMNAIVGLTDAMLAADIEAKQREQLQLVERSGRAMVAMIGDLLDVAKIEAGHLELESIPLDLVRVIRDIASLFEPSARKKGLELRLEMSPDVPAWVLGDPLRLRQVLANLVGNAVKFTERGSVTLAVSAVDDRFTFSVSDTGIGIPKADREHVFQPFFQVDRSHTRRYGGTGLGLAIARDLVERMGGSIALDSTEGCGTTLTVRVTLLPATAPVGAMSPVPEPVTTRGKPVLVVDDNPINLKVAQILLERLGVTTETASCGKDAVARFSPGKYAAILMDVQMPDMNGYDVTQAIREREAGQSRVPILALTASAMPSELDRVKAAGMDDLLTKPITIAHLSTALRAVLTT